MHAKYVLIYDPGERQPVEHGVARFPHVLAESVAKPILAQGKIEAEVQRTTSANIK